MIRRVNGSAVEGRKKGCDNENATCETSSDLRASVRVRVRGLFARVRASAEFHAQEMTATV